MVPSERGDCGGPDSSALSQRRVNSVNVNENTLETMKAPTQVPQSGKCKDVTCGSGWNRKSNLIPTAPCTDVTTCEFNCCEVDINSDKLRRNEVLTLTVLMALKNVTRLSNDVNFPVKHNHSDFARDMEALLDHVAGLYKVMHDVLKETTLLQSDVQSDCPKGDYTSIRTCVHKALCVIEHNVDTRKSDEGIKTYTLLMEYYSRFDDITWDKLMGDVSEEGGKPVDNMKVDYMPPDELSCSGITGFMHDLGGLIQTGASSDSSVKAAAYRASAALLDAARSTHVLLDYHTHTILLWKLPLRRFIELGSLHASC